LSSAYLKDYQSVKPAQIEWRDKLPYSLEFKDVYFSIDGAVEESAHVFIQGNQLEKDWQQANQEQFNLVELGFGSGLNFFNSANTWRKLLTESNSQRNQSNQTNKQLNYIAIEKRPFSLHDFNRCRKLWPQFNAISEHLSNNYPQPIFGRYKIHFPQINLNLILLFMPVEMALDDLIQESANRQNQLTIDHWFLDGFAPTNNPAMWQQENAEKIARLSHHKSRIASYSVAASVKNPLKNAGFNIQKRPGFGRKREMLTAILEQPSAPQQQSKIVNKWVNIKVEKPWFNWSQVCNKKSKQHTKIAIIGAGIAGCTSAYSLTKKGYYCQVFESSDRLASAASGASCGIFHPSLTADMNLASQLNWQAFQCLIQHLDCHQDADTDSKKLAKHWLTKGIFRLQSGEKTKQLLSMVNQLGIAETIQQTERKDGLFIHSAGALDMAKYCQNLIDLIPQSQLKLSLQHKVIEIKHNTKGWQLSAENNKSHQEHQFEHIIDCSGASQSVFSLIEKGFDHQTFENESHLTGGQTCLFQSQKLSQHIKQLICEKIYIIPLADSNFILGSTFDQKLHKELDFDSQRNLFEQLNQLLVKLQIPVLTQQQIKAIPLVGHRAVRRHSQDRLPIVGPAINRLKLVRDFNQLGQKRLARSQMDFYNYPGLWVNRAYGSHGLLYSMLCSQHLASLIGNEPSPLSTPLSHALHPARFIIRQLKRKG